MCGIYGYWSRQRAALPEHVLGAMAQALVHRGPDDEGSRHSRERGVAVGNRRLSIIDLAGGHQPFVSDDGMVALVQNGEIFNYVELASELRAQGVQLRTESDTEVLLRLYEREGIGFVSRLNGMFAIAIDDAREDALYLIRDRIGVKPLYYGEVDGLYVFGSEIKALLPVLGLQGRESEIDLEALHHYLTFNYVPPPWTMWRRIRHVMPGTWMRFGRSATVQTERWWSLAAQSEQACRFEPWADEFLATLDDATRIRLRCDVPWGAFLSGGVDSSAIVALMARHVQRPVKTFCIGFEDPRFDESGVAATAAARFGCDHTSEIAAMNMLDRWPFVLHHLDQPHGDASFMPTLRVSELAARHVKVVLTGDGGDELFAGYDKYADFFADEAIGELPETAFRRRYVDSISLFDHSGKLAIYQPALASALAPVDSYARVAEPWLREAGHFDRVNQVLYLDMQLLLSGNNLVKPDRMGMAVSIEARTPFLDWRMMEFAFRSPGATKLGPGGDKKHWYKKAVEPLIGSDLAHRRKQMFTVPIGEWFRGSSYPWLAGVLGDERLERWIRPEETARMLEAHRAGTGNFTRELRALAALSLWLREALP